MRTRIILGLGLLLLGAAETVRAQEVIWRPAGSIPTSPPAIVGAPPVTLGKPRDLPSTSNYETPPRVVRGQFGDPPPPPPYVPGPTPPPASFPTPTGPAAADMV